MPRTSDVNQCSRCVPVAPLAFNEFIQAFRGTPRVLTTISSPPVTLHTVVLSLGISQYFQPSAVNSLFSINFSSFIYVISFECLH